MTKINSIWKFIAVSSKKAGFDAYTFSSPMEALTAKYSIKPEVVALDVNMPDVSGFELAAVMCERENCHDVPILFLTADSNISSELDVLRLGGDAFLGNLDKVLAIREQFSDADHIPT